MATSTRFARLARWALIGAAVLMGVALLATVWSTNQGVRSASETLVRGQASVFHDGIQVRLRLEAQVSDDTLAAIIDDLGEQGLRYLAVLDGSGQVMADAGLPSQGRAEVAAAFAAARPGVPAEIDGRVRVVYGKWKLRRAQRRSPDAAPARGTMPFLFEFEPRVAAELRVSASRALGLGALAAGALMLVALGLVRWFWHREALERQLEHERRLASLGEMSAVLAHEIRNPLASLKGNAQLLARALPDGERSRAKAERVVDEAVRLEALTRDLLEFARSSEIRRAEVDPAALLRDAAAAVDPERITVEAAGAPSVWPLDRERVRQVLTNLLENAVAVGESRVVATVSREDGCLAFVVRDDGPGIEETERERIFEPFFTRRTRGTGLGLAVAKRLVELHGGTITADNVDRGGAVFRVLLPRR